MRGFIILVVEDSDDDAFLLRRACEKHAKAREIHRVRDGHEATTYLEGKSQYDDRNKYPFPDLLFVDLKMPRMSGLELLSWIRNHSEFRAIPIIIMSSSNRTEDIQRAYHLGANTFFVKPSSFQELGVLVSKIHNYWEESETPVVVLSN